MSLNAGCRSSHVLHVREGRPCTTSVCMLGQRRPQLEVLSMSTRRPQHNRKAEAGRKIRIGHHHTRSKNSNLQDTGNKQGFEPELLALFVCVLLVAAWQSCRCPSPCLFISDAVFVGGTSALCAGVCLAIKPPDPPHFEISKSIDLCWYSMFDFGSFDTYLSPHTHP